MRKKLTEEEKKIAEENRIKKFEEEALKSNLKGLLIQYIPEPTRSFKLDERVAFGNHEYSKIVEIFNDRIYKVCTLNKGKESYNYLSWTDLYPYRTREENDLIPSLFENSIMDRISFQNRSIDGLILSYYHFGIDMNPQYQRDFVWSQEEKVKLIDSIFKHLDIGKFVLIERPFKEGDYHYEILDGKQRLRAILDFYEGRLLYKGKTYADLNYRDMNIFDNVNISVAISPPLEESDKYMYFLRLNVGGRVQDPNHLAYVEKLLKESNQSME